MKNDPVSKRQTEIELFFMIHASFLRKHGTVNENNNNNNRPNPKGKIKLNKWLCVLGILIGGSFIQNESKRNENKERK